MKILQVAHGFPPGENGGVELYTFHLSRALLEKGHRVTVFCREADPEKEEFSSSTGEMEGVKVTRVVNNLTRIPNSRVLYDNSFFDQVFSDLLRQEKPDLIHFQHFIALSANLLRVAESRGYPVVLTLHDFFILCHRIQLLKGDGRLCGGPLYGLECASCLDWDLPRLDARTRSFLRLKKVLPFSVVRWIKRFFIPPKYLGDPGYEVFHRYRFMYEIFKIPETVLVPSRFVRETFLRYYPILRSKIQILPLGIPSIQRRQCLRGEGKKIRFCYFGNLLPFKGVHVLIKAFKRLPEGKATLTLYGEKKPWRGTFDYFDSLVHQDSAGSVDFRGVFQSERIAEALDDQDVLVLPSLCPESFSLAIREAHTLGLPVIASRIGAIPEAVEGGKNGLLFEAGDEEGLVRCMLRFIEEPDLVRKMRDHMPKAKFMDEHATELESLYTRILQREGKALSSRAV